MIQWINQLDDMGIRKVSLEMSVQMCKMRYIDRIGVVEIGRKFNVPHSTVARNTCQICAMDVLGRARTVTQKSRDWKEAYCSGKQCLICGYKDWRALEFHHLDPSKKEITIGRVMTIKRKEEEAKKCVILCRNCHTLAHWEERHGGGEIWERLLAEKRRRDAISSCGKKTETGKSLRGKQSSAMEIYKEGLSSLQIL